MIDVSAVDLDEIATALADQNYEFRWLFHSRTGDVVLWTPDTGVDGHNPVDLDELDEDLVWIAPLRSYVWYQDMVDFADGISDERAGRRLSRWLEQGPAFLILQQPLQNSRVR
jgi:hypothetical protein